MDVVSKYSRRVFLKYLDISECKGKVDLPNIVTNFPNLERLSIRFLEMDDLTEGGEYKEYKLENLKFLNITNLHSNDLLDIIECPNLEHFICSGYTLKDAPKLTSWIVNKKHTLKQLDVSRTCLKEADIKTILDECHQLEVFAATEIMKRNEESRYSLEYPRVKFLFDLLSHQISPINSKKHFVHCLYNVDGLGCSLLADAIYVGTELNVLRFIIDEFQIDINKYNIQPDPWKLPYPMKHMTNKNRLPIPLHQAAMLGYYDITEHLLRVGADVNLKCDPCNRPALSHVLLKETDQETSSNMFSLLLHYGAKVDIEDNEGITPVDIVVRKKMIITLWLMVNSHHLTQREKDMILFGSIELGDESIFATMLGKGANPLSKNKFGENILTHAIKKNSLPGIKMICKRIERIDDLLLERDSRGWSPYHYLLVETPKSILTSILETISNKINGANIHWKGTLYGETFQRFCEKYSIDEERKNIFFNYVTVEW